MNITPEENAQSTYVALLRGINVGGHAQIKMSDLRRAFEALGFLDVRTVLASGNVLFQSANTNKKVLSEAISRELKTTFGRDIFVIVRSQDELRELVHRRPFGDFENKPGARLFVTFLSENARSGNMSSRADGEDYRIVSTSDGVLCSVLYGRQGAGASGLMGTIEREFGQNVTTRSWNTVVRLAK